MIRKFVFLGLLALAYCQPTPQENNAQKLDEIKQRISRVDDDYERRIQRIISNVSPKSLESGANVAAELQSRDADFRRYKAQRDRLVTEYKTNLLPAEQSRILQNKLGNRRTDNVPVIEHELDLLSFKIINFKFDVVEAIYQLFDPRIIKTSGLIEADGPNTFLNLENDKNFMERKGRALDDAQRKIKEYAETISSEIENILKYGNDRYEQQLMIHEKNKLNEILDEENDWFNQKRRIMFRKYGPVAIQYANMVHQTFTDQKKKVVLPKDRNAAKERMAEIVNLIKALQVESMAEINRLNAEKEAPGTTENELEIIKEAKKIVQDTEYKQYWDYVTEYNEIAHAFDFM